ncbi:kinocilin-like [Sinocyclocheilus rhinocerous]|uniref:kinocilin-like n=1 Tax=Sinocyclocheilus rhinocerous TaxID=307959 RepID=UPI0007B924D4|nr:PREDICTED: kinocilin-like [Sinocyclocheilus rhinocerous]
MPCYKASAALENILCGRLGTSGLLISVYPFIRAWFNFHHILPNIGNFRVHPMATNSNPAAEQPAATLTREGTQSQLNVERSKSRMGTFVETAAPTAAEGSQDDGPSADVPDILGRRKFKSPPSDQDPL